MNVSALSQAYPNKRPRTNYGSEPINQRVSMGRVLSASNIANPQASAKYKSVDQSEEAKQKRLQAIQEALAEQEEEEREQAFALERLKETGIKKSNPYYDKLLQVHVDEYRRMKAGPPPPRRSPSPDPFKVIGFHPIPTDNSKKDIASSKAEERTSKDDGSFEISQLTPSMNRPSSPTRSPPGIERMSSGSSSEDSLVVDTSVVGFVKASLKAKGKILEPSKAALEMAEKKLQKWSEEEQEMLDDSLLDVVTDTPCPARTKSVVGEDVASGRSVQFQRPQSPLQGQSAKKGGAFRSPLIGNVTSKTVYPRAGSSNLAKSSHPLAATPINASQVQSTHLGTSGSASTSAAFSTPVRPGPAKATIGESNAGSFKRASDGRPKFETPFKPGMKPGDPSRAILLEQTKAKLSKRDNFVDPWDDDMGDDSETNLRHNEPEKPVVKVAKHTLQNSGLRPRRFTGPQLESYGIEYDILKQITPQTAPFYAFNLTSPPMGPAIPASQAHAKLGWEAAYNNLQSQGCKLATKDWVQCQWSLILWKLAGMACLDPKGEIIEGGGKEKWAWEEAKGQLKQRYKHEFDEGKRPALRLIVAGDASPATPMVLCVTNITWKESHYDENGVHVAAHPTLEVTDGWYKLRARVDEPLGKACLRQRIRIGTKLAILGAKLDAERKEGQEIMEAYNSTSLIFNGNGTHRAPWYEKLGFHKASAPGRIPFMPTMGSLTPNGGVIPVLDLVVEKVYPIGFVEYLFDDDGNKKVLGPFTESDEAEECDKWNQRREKESLKIRDDLEMKWSQLESLADRLERAAGLQFKPRPDDSMPDHIDNLFDELESTPPNRVPAFIRRLASEDAGWLAKYIHAKVLKEKENSSEVVEKELAELCPLRVTQNFRVVIVRDAYTERKPAHRSAQVTVWDVLNLTLSEGAKPGAFEPGQRFMMTNLKPTQVGSWMRNEPGAEVYMCTRKDTRITRLK